MCIRDRNNLPYDVVVERLHIEEPEPPAPVTETEKTFEEVLDEHPVSIQVNGQWQTFPNAKAAEEMCIRDRASPMRSASILASRPEKTASAILQAGARARS